MKEDHFVGKISQKAILEHEGKILVARGVGDSLWELSGGHLHADEEPEIGLAREIEEELKITLGALTPLWVGRSLHVKSNTWRILIVYHGQVLGNGVVTADKEEVEETRWVSREELKALPLFDDCRAAVVVFLGE